MRSLHLEKSGIKQVWDGCEFSNGEIVGTWVTNTPSYGYYKGVNELNSILFHPDNNLSMVVGEDLCSNGGSFLWLVSKNYDNLAVPGCPWIAEGMRFRNGWICLIHMLKESSIYWYPSLDILKMIYEERSHIILDSSNIGYPKFDVEHPVWQRDNIHF